MPTYINGELDEAADLQNGLNGGRFVKGAAEAWDRMVRDAAGAGVTLAPGRGGSYRDVGEQERLSDKYKAGKGNLAAEPGTSDHGWGLAIDIDEDQSGAVEWLRAYGARHGWSETVSGEPWHWAYTGGKAVTSPLSGSKATSSGPAPNPEGEPLKADRYPSGGELLNGPKGLVLRYKTGPSVFVEWDVTDEEALVNSGYSASQAEVYSQPAGELVQGGDAAELGELLDAGFDSVEEFIDATINDYFSPFDPARNDPEIQAVISRLMANPDAPPALVDAWLRNTDYWNRTNQAKKDWNSLPEAEQQRLISEGSQRIADEFWASMGERISTNDSRLKTWSTQIASGQKTFTQVTQEVRDLAVQNPESPFSRSNRNEGINKQKFGTGIKNRAEAARQEALRWGIQLSTSSAEEWATRMELTGSEDPLSADFMKYLQDTSSIMFPWKDKNVATIDAASPWLESYRRTMEIGDVELTNPDIMRALQAGTSLPDFEKELRSKPEWYQTKNAKDTLSSAFGGVGQIMEMI